MTDTPLDLIYLTTMVNLDHDIHDHDIGDAVLYQPSEACNLVKKAIDKFTSRYDHGHGWHAPTPASYYVPAPTSAFSSMDPMQILATLAFVAFLLQNLMALIDRLTMNTRIVQARDDKKYEKAQEVHDAIKKFSAKKWDSKK